MSAGPETEHKRAYWKTRCHNLELSNTLLKAENNVMNIKVASALSNKLDCTSSGYKQARASLDIARRSLSVPHPDLGDIEIPYVDCTLINCSKVPCSSRDLILCTMYENQSIIVKRRPSLFQTVSEYHVLFQLKQVLGIPEPLGIIYKYGESFVVMKVVDSCSQWTTLEDALCLKAFSIMEPSMWKVILVRLWELLDAIHGMGYIHNNVTPSNVVLSVQEDGDIMPYLVGFSLACHHNDVTHMSAKHSKSFHESIHHLPSDVIYGKMPVGFKSDIYCFGSILRKIHTKSLLLPQKDDFWDSVSVLANHCCKTVQNIPFGFALGKIVAETLGTL